MPHTLSQAEYRAVLRSIPLNQNRVEVRLLAVVLTGLLMFGMLKPLFYLLTVKSSPIYRVNELATYHWLVPCLFFTGALLALPHLLVLVANPKLLSWRAPRKLAALAGGFGAVAWMCLAWIARPLDYGFTPLMYAASAFGCAVIGGVYGLSLNAQQLREIARRQLEGETNEEI